MSDRRFRNSLLAATLIWPLLLIATLLLLLRTPPTPTPVSKPLLATLVELPAPPAPPVPAPARPVQRAPRPVHVTPAPVPAPPPHAPPPPPAAPAAHAPVVPTPPAPPPPAVPAHVTAPTSPATSLGRDDSGVQVLHQEVPDVPDDWAGGALRAQVLLRFEVRADGSFSVRILQSSGVAELDQVALQAAANWRFAAAIAAGQAVASHLDVVFPFEVDD